MSIYTKEARDIFVIGQVMTRCALGQSFTTYDLIKLLDNTPPTSRKILNTLVESGMLVKEKEEFRVDTIRYVYSVSPLGQLFLIGNKDKYIAQLEMLWSQLGSAGSNE